MAHKRYAGRPFELLTTSSSFSATVCTPGALLLYDEHRDDISMNPLSALASSVSARNISFKISLQKTEKLDYKKG